MEVVVVRLLDMSTIDDKNDKLLAICKNQEVARKYVMADISKIKEEHNYPEPKIRIVPCHMHGFIIDAEFKTDELEVVKNYGLGNVKVIEQ